ncbi:hypothetical protein ACLKA6_002669 [Drosophila palustris]
MKPGSGTGYQPWCSAGQPNQTGLCHGRRELYLVQMLRVGRNLAGIVPQLTGIVPRPNTTVDTKRRTPERLSEPKKWSDKEVGEILNYMQVHRNIEKPTAQIYYKKLLEQTKIEVTWNLVRYKVRHLRTGWQKANLFSKSTGAGVEEGDAETTVRAKLLKMCPYYDQLDDIYSGGKDVNVVVVESEDRPLWTSDNSVVDQESIVEALFLIELDDSSNLNDSNFTELSFVEKTKMKARKTSLAQLVSIESNLSQFREDRLKQVDQFVWNKELEERKLRLEEDRKEMDERKLRLEERQMDLKEKQADNEFKLKQQELEQKERILKLELELKYKNHN